MKIPHPRFLHLAAGAAALSVVTAVLVAMTGHGAWSQTTKTIKLIVPSPPGGSSDVLARLLAEEISRAKGPTIVIENRQGRAP